MRFTQRLSVILPLTKTEKL